MDERARGVSGWETWIESEEIPIHRVHGVSDVMVLELGPWPRLGGLGAYVELFGMEGVTGLYVAEIPPGGQLEPERHLFDKTIYVVAGRGSTKVWTGDRANSDRRSVTFEWEAGAMFSPPMNAWHQLYNLSGSEPVRFIAATIAPMVMDIFHNPDFVYNCDYAFTDRFSAQPDFFEVKERIFFEPDRKWLWETNLIPNARAAFLNPDSQKKKGGRSTHYQMSGNVLAGHVSEFPSGCYHQAHYHGGGAIFINIGGGTGYTMMWPQDVGPHPYASGNEDKIVRVEWKDGSLYSPPSGWFHQHFNTGDQTVRQLALRLGSHRHKVTFHEALSGEGTLVSIKEGGALVTYADEDPEISRRFKQELEQLGLEYQMDKF
jgi:quercetin dioxygenase-like cupin family protein/oxalate decarboxylase/phosphoglucose isomerase-like protein (cupin superfamily)